MNALILMAIQVLGPALIDAGKALVSLHEKHVAAKNAALIAAHHNQLLGQGDADSLEYAASQEQINLDKELDNLFKKD